VGLVFARRVDKKSITSREKKASNPNKNARRRKNSYAKDFCESFCRIREGRCHSHCRREFYGGET